MNADSPQSSRQNPPGRILVAGSFGDWSPLVAPLVDHGFQVEMIPDVDRAVIRCVEQVVDAVVVELRDQEEEIAKALRMLQRVSHYTKVIALCESAQQVPPHLAGHDNLQRVVTDVSPRDFTQIMRTAVRVARLARERGERIQTLKSLATKVQDPSRTTGDLEKLLGVLQEQTPRTVFPRLKLPEINTLTEVLARSLDPFTASRAAVDFIERCLPGAMVVSWLVGPEGRTGLAACTGNDGAGAVLSAKLLRDIEVLHLPRVLRGDGSCAVSDVRQLVGGDAYESFAGRWAMLAPCRANGECFAAILIVGPVGERPSQAEQGLGHVCLALATQLAFDARIHRRIFPVWPNEASDEESDSFG
jgi:hypothetical protein